MPQTFPVLLKRFKAYHPGTSFQVTRRALSLGAEGSTGWYAKSFAETQVDTIIISKALQKVLLSMGVYATHDAIGVTDTAYAEGDEIQDGFDNFWRVETAMPITELNRIDRYLLQLSRMPLHPNFPVSRLTNGDFELGALTGWTSLYAYINSYQQRSGVYCCYLDNNGYIQQTINTPVNMLSQLHIWRKGPYDFCTSSYAQIRVTITYSDATTTIIDSANTQDNVYEQLDLLPYLTAGKTISTMKIQRTSGQSAVYLDDITLNIGHTLPLFEILLRRLQTRGLTANVTLRSLSLGAPNATTDWYEPTYTTSTITMVPISAAARLEMGKLGVMGVYPFAWYTVSRTPKAGDEMLDDNGNYYKIDGIIDHIYGDHLIMRECSLFRMDLHEALT